MNEHTIRFRRNLESAVREYGFPLCFESQEEYNKWLESETICHTLDFKNNVCEDCTVDFQKQMISEGKCVNPEFFIKNG